MNFIKKIFFALIAISILVACNSEDPLYEKALSEHSKDVVEHSDEEVSTISIPINLSIDNNSTRAMRFDETKVYFPKAHLAIKVATRIGDKVVPQTLIFKHTEENGRDSYTYKGNIKVPLNAIDRDNNIADNLEIAAILLKSYPYPSWNIYDVPKPDDAPEPYPYVRPTDQGAPSNISNNDINILATDIYPDGNKYTVTVLPPKRAYDSSGGNLKFPISSFSEWSKLELLNNDGELSFKKKTLSFRTAGTLVNVELNNRENLDFEDHQYHYNFLLLKILISPKKVSYIWSFDFRGESMERSIKNEQKNLSFFVKNTDEIIPEPYNRKDEDIPGEMNPFVSDYSYKPDHIFRNYYSIWLAPDYESYTGDEEYSAIVGIQGELHKWSKNARGYDAFRYRFATNYLKEKLKLSSRIKIVVNIPNIRQKHPYLEYLRTYDPFPPDPDDYGDDDI